MAKAIRSRRLKRIINSYILAQDEPIQEKKLNLLQRYLHQKGIGNVTIKVLKKKIKDQQDHMERDKRLNKMENALFKKEEETKNYRYGSAFCPNCSMYKDHEKECPYCGKLELTR